MAFPPASPRRSTTGIVVAVLVVLAVVVAGAVAAGVAAWRLFDDDRPRSTALADPPTPSTGPTPQAPADLSRFYGQKLEWRNCASGNQCTWLRVPLDYARPDGETLRLAVVRVPAQQRSKRIGQLVVNPGGPGGSAIDYALSGSLAFGEPIARYFDLVGMDPRGVGKSAPLRCLDTKQRDRFVAFDPSPDTPAEVAGLDREIKRFGDSCLRNSGELARYMSTVEVAKDMDILRAALGEAKLDYHGASYGTLVGATYAELFPRNVRRMVLDGAIDPALSNLELTLGQARGFQTALRAFLADCVQRGCPVGNDVESAQRRIERLLRDIDADPLPTGSTRELTEGLATSGIALPLYAKSLWPALRQALSQALDGDGSGLLRLADQYNRRGPDRFIDNGTNALYAVNCLDHGDSIPSREVPQYFPRFDRAAPTFSRWFAYSLSTCSTWPVQSRSATKAMAAEGAPPIVVIGTTRDPATPYAWAKGLASELSSGVLVSRNGDGHTGFQMGNRCVDNAVNRYFLRGIAPRDGLRC